MIVNFYYKDPDAATEALGPVIQKKYPEIKPYSKDYWDKHRELMKNLTDTFGELASGSEDLYIDIDTDNHETISVNGSKYRLVI